MNAILTAQKLKIKPADDYASSKLALGVSVFLHIAVLVLGGITVNMSKPEKQIIDSPPIEVQFVEAEQAPQEEPPKPVEEPKASSNMAPKALDKPEPPQPPEVPVEETVEEEPQEKQEVAPPAASIPMPTKKDTSKAKELIEKAREKKEEQAKQKEEEFTSVLKNLVGEKNPTPGEITEEDEPATQFPEAVLTRGTALNLSEQNAIRDQLAGCWNVIPGARDAEDLVVAVTMQMNPDATIQSAQIVDQWRYNNDSFFRAAADSALRAVRNPQCNPLKLPLNKYDQWKKITIRFDPKEMF